MAAARRRRAADLLGDRRAARPVRPHPGDVPRRAARRAASAAPSTASASCARRCRTRWQRAGVHVSARRSRLGGTAVARVAFEQAPLLLFVRVLAFFASRSAAFLTGRNLVNIVTQSASTAVVATGMTFVLLTGGVDLSVGAIMFVAAAVAGKLLLAGHSLPLALGAMLLVGLLARGRQRLLRGAAARAAVRRHARHALPGPRARALDHGDPRDEPAEGFLRLGTERLLGCRCRCSCSPPLPLLRAPRAALDRVRPRDLRRGPRRRPPRASAGLRVERQCWRRCTSMSGACAAVGAMLALAQLGCGFRRPSDATRSSRRSPPRCSAAPACSADAARCCRARCWAPC